MRFLLLLFLFTPSVAHADFEGWFVTEARLPVYVKNARHEHRISLRLLTDFRVAERSQGLQQALARVGFTYEPRSWLTLASQTNFNFQRTSATNFVQEYRQEFEATFQLPLAASVTFTHRQRFELRWSNGVFGVRHRLLVRASFPISEPVHPFIFSETFILPSGDFFNQHRLVAGFVWRARKNVHFEIGYLYRLRSTSPTTFAHDHGPRFGLTFIPSYEGEIQNDSGSE